MNNSHERETYDVRFIWPFTAQIIGYSGCGKSSMLFEMFQRISDIFHTRPDIIFYFYDIYQPLFSKMKEIIPNIEFYEGFPQDISDHLKQYKSPPGGG